LKERTVLTNSPSSAETELDSAVGWISTAELFLLVGAIMVAVAALIHGQLGASDRANHDLTATLQEARGRIAALEATGERTARELKSAQDLLATRTRELAEIEAKLRTARMDLEAQKGAVTELTAQLQRAVAEKARAESKVKELATELARARKRADDADKLDAELRSTRQRADRAESALRTANARVALFEDALARATKRVDELRAKYDEADRALRAANARLAELGATERVLTKKIDALEKKVGAYENRFEGLTLQGARVVLLVDHSGSMGMTSEDVVAPEKWPLVCKSAARILQSLPNLTQFQVIVFSSVVA
jgi:chromosome segregation ATPase